VNTGSAVIKQLHITWNIPSVLVPAVEVWVNSGGDFEHHSTVTGTTNSYTVPAVQIGRVYEVKLRSKNAFNVYSDFCTSVFHTVALPTELFWRSYGAMIAPFWKNRNVTPVTMTSNHSEGALVTASNESYGAGWHALTSGAYAGWEADTSFAWLQVRLDVAPLVPVTKMFLQGPPDDEGKTPQEFTLHGSHDGVTWNLLLYFYWGPVVPVGLKSYEFSNTELWTYYKLTVTNTAGGGHTGLRIFSLHNTRFWSH
jgi:hypothetical protein